MSSAEMPRSENLEEEKTPEQAPEQNPEQILNNGVSAVENKDAADPVISSKWVQEARKFFSWKEILGAGKEIGRVLADEAILGTALYVKVTKFGILKFLWQLIKNRGKMTFKEGYEIGKDMFSFEGKKEKN